MISNYDQWLTSPPVDPLEPWDEAVLSHVSEQFFEAEQNRFLVSDTYWNWLAKCSDKACPYYEGTHGAPIKKKSALSDQQCAQLIERAFNIYKHKLNYPLKNK
jgi:hypothetical protein